MAIISENSAFGTQTKVVSPRIEILWDPTTNDGPVEFHLEQMTVKRQLDDSLFVVERFFLHVLTVQISSLIGRSYEITAPATTEVDPTTGQSSKVPGEKVTEPGVHLLLGIKAATRSAYDANVVTPDPDADPIARRVTIIWNPLNNAGNVSFQVEDRGQALGVLSESIAGLTAPAYVIPDLANGGHLDWAGWKLEAMIKAATDAAYLASVYSQTIGSQPQ
ncbi:hypothetical protein [Xanthomonas campestris]|uniref:hypothetical protein n=1 Tax=Xanthomonas campestris TaxID=339 RepID=UPI001E3EEB3E|nr:hypothetical protein [Xanthomonas campestris]MCC5074290.1 hypothetical protein [Xanthomonas campestris pv. plantaginis]